MPPFPSPFPPSPCFSLPPPITPFPPSMGRERWLWLTEDVGGGVGEP